MVEVAQIFDKHGSITSVEHGVNLTTVNDPRESVTITRSTWHHGSHVPGPPTSSAAAALVLQVAWLILVAELVE